MSVRHRPLECCMGYIHHGPEEGPPRLKLELLKIVLSCRAAIEHCILDPTDPLFFFPAPTPVERTHHVTLLPRRPVMSSDGGTGRRVWLLEPLGARAVLGRVEIFHP